MLFINWFVAAHLADLYLHAQICIFCEQAFLIGFAPLQHIKFLIAVKLSCVRFSLFNSVITEQIRFNHCNIDQRHCSFHFT